MDKILAHRAKFCSSIPEKQETIEKIRNFTTKLNETILNNIDNIADQNKAIQKLKETVSYQKDKLAVEQQKVIYSINEIENQLDIMEELIDKLGTLRLENNKSELKIDELKRIKPNPKDQQLLELERKKLNYYRNLTGVVWNHQVINDSTSGFITDWQEYMQSFYLTKNEKKTEIKLWAEISKRSQN